MKFDLFTKVVLSSIACLLAVNLFSNSQIFPTNSVEAAPAAFLQVGKTYNFIYSHDTSEIGKVVSIEANGWIKISKFYNETNQSGEIFINSDLYKLVIPMVEQK